MEFRELFSSETLTRRSVIAIMAANSIPLIGVLFFGWNLFNIMFLYWLESAVIGVFNILKMIRVHWLWSIFLVPFFTVHYGLFMYVHLIFIFALFTHGVKDPFLFSSVLALMNREVLFACISFFVSHGYSYFHNFIGKEEYKIVTAQKLFNQPYSRIILMHFTILFGGWLVMLLHEPVLALCLLVVLKTAADIRSHVKQHELPAIAIAPVFTPSL